jgi:hypothetical protein
MNSASLLAPLAGTAGRREEDTHRLSVRGCDPANHRQSVPLSDAAYEARKQDPHTAMANRRLLVGGYDWQWGS